jgi:lysophospholipase L1-like esterase
VPADDPLLLYFGRWDTTPARAITVNTGSEIRAAFVGAKLALTFDASALEAPMPTLWIRVDDGEWREVELAPSVEVEAPGPADQRHVLRVIVKGLREHVNRWTPPLKSAVVFTGVVGGEGFRMTIPPEPPRRSIEFLGDSITEGILAVRKGDPKEWPTLSDGRRGYAFQTAELLGASPRVVGFGRLGITVPGNGGVPRAIESFPYVYGKVRFGGDRPTAVVVNLGTNDAKAPGAVFTDEYLRYLKAIRNAYPHAWVFAVRPLNGAHEKDIVAALKQLKDDKRTLYVDTTGWIAAEKDTTDGVHPNLAGHRKVAEKLAAAIRKAASI